jgi:hypothetical protein
VHQRIRSFGKFGSQWYSATAFYFINNVLTAIDVAQQEAQVGDGAQVQGEDF